MILINAINSNHSFVISLFKIHFSTPPILISWPYYSKIKSIFLCFLCLIASSPSHIQMLINLQKCSFYSNLRVSLKFLLVISIISNFLFILPQAEFLALIFRIKNKSMFLKLFLIAFMSLEIPI
jgi:hypothetical protein